MANNLIPEELNALIQQYLTDGVLTDKERQVILNKAEKMGLDRDEIDLYLDAEVQKIDQQTDAAARKQKGKTCPYCGGSIPLLTDKCPLCGGNITAEASKELQEIFDNLEEALVNLKSGMDIHASKATVERFARKAKMYFGSNPKVQKLLEEVESETITAEKKAIYESRKNLAGRILSNKWVLYLLYVLLVPVLSIFMASYHRDCEEESRAKYAEVVNEIIAKYNNVTNIVGGVNWDILLQDHPEDYLKYQNQITPIEREIHKHEGLRNLWASLGFGGGSIIAIIIGIILLTTSLRKKKSSL